LFVFGSATASLYANITNLRWDYDEQHTVKGCTSSLFFCPFISNFAKGWCSKSACLSCSCLQPRKERRAPVQPQPCAVDGLLHHKPPVGSDRGLNESLICVCVFCWLVGGKWCFVPRRFCGRCLQGNFFWCLSRQKNGFVRSLRSTKVKERKKKKRRKEREKKEKRKKKRTEQPRVKDHRGSQCDSERQRRKKQTLRKGFEGSL